METKTKKLVTAALFAALACVATMIIKFPSPLKGYLNIGDCIVLLCGWMLSPVYGFVAAGLGSGLADLLSGYLVYAPATFIIEGLIACYTFKLIRKSLGHNLPARIVSGILAEIIMVLGYYVFEGFMYGFIASAVNIPANAIQGIVGLILGTILIKAFEKSKITIE